MLKKFSLLFAGIGLTLLACTTSGPQAALDRLASAMDNKDPSLFLAGIDMKAYSANYIRDMTSSDSALNSLNELGNLLGLGSLDNLIGSVVDVQAKLRKEFERGVASGQLIIQCGEATTPDCPWYPEALRNARVVELNENAAIASVTTPAGLTSWLALDRRGEDWQVTGRAVLEKTAEEIARKSAPATSPAASPKGKVEI